MSKTLGGWIHSFTVTDTVTHKKGYTVYKITSIVFPRAIPEALTCITVWKRFHEVKKLYRDLSKRHKSLHIRGQLPEPKESSFFKRFDPEVIQGRKSYILELLDFAAQHPALYKSHPFLNFFENGHTPNTSPIHHKSNIEAICDSLDLTYDEDISLIDPTKDKDLEQKQIKSVNETTEKNDVNEQETPSNETEIVNESKTENTLHRTLAPTISFEGDDNDYIYEAAYEFSQAVQAEVNQEYQKAYEKYKLGVEKLLTGSKDDCNEERRFVAKAKVSKYMNRADELYEKYLLNIEDNKKTVQLSVDITDSSKEIYLERPWNQLSKFKVLQIIDTVMQVQDVTDKSVYIMKVIEKPSSNSMARSIFLPQDVPYMVRLLGFFQSESAIYLLLRQAKGGKLFDHIRAYTPTGHLASSLNEIFTEIKSPHKQLEVDESGKIGSVNTTPYYDSGFVELLNEYKNSGDKISLKDDEDSEVRTSSESTDDRSSREFEDAVEEVTEEIQDYIPSFDILSQDMDVNDLVSCSQKLLQSVSNTLEQFKETKIDDKILKQINQRIDEEKDEINEIKIEEPEIVKNEINLTSAETINPRKRVVLPEASIKQWARELVTAIDSLHQKGVILGDLRPDNILLGSKGQLLLSYFYQSEGSECSIRNSLNSSALENLYVAPERPLTIKSDWWSFGVILFELLTGYTFKSCHPGFLSSYFDVQYPEVEVSNTAKDLLDQILQYNQEHRIGVSGVKSHVFFEGTVWEDVVQKGVNSF